MKVKIICIIVSVFMLNGCNLNKMYPVNPKVEYNKFQTVYYQIDGLRIEYPDKSEVVINNKLC